MGNNTLPVIIRLLILLAFTAVLHARTLRVPQEFATIQAALDSVAASDTVFVSLGFYAEALIAPLVRFSLIGEFEPDSAAPRPILDATNIPVQDSAGALTIPEQSFPYIANFNIRNVGHDGVATWADATVLSNCVVEQCYVGLVQNRFFSNLVMIVNDCMFRECEFMCVSARSGNTLYASRSSFSSSTDEVRPIVGTGHSVLDSCQFQSEAGISFDIAERLLLLATNSSVITDCVFGPTRAAPFQGVIALGGMPVRFINNVVEDCESGYRVLHVSSPTPDSIEIRGNTFRNCRGILGSEGTLGLQFVPGSESIGPLIAGNRFENCSGYITCDDLWPATDVSVRIENNWFIHDSINGLPSIGGTWPWQETPITLRNNVFINCGYAVHGSPTTDAAFNYWGHSSGPYHASDNVDGLGDTITGPVSFAPWLEDTVSSSIEGRGLIRNWAISALYPNPFNGDFEIEISGQPSSGFSVRLFDLLGRQVALLHEGVVRGSALHVTAPRQLASGIYFVSARDRYHSVVQKVVLLK